MRPSFRGAGGTRALAADRHATLHASSLGTHERATEVSPARLRSLHLLSAGLLPAPLARGKSACSARNRTGVPARPVRLNRHTHAHNLPKLWPRTYSGTRSCSSSDSQVEEVFGVGGDCARVSGPTSSRALSAAERMSGDHADSSGTSRARGEGWGSHTDAPHNAAGWRENVRSNPAFRRRRIRVNRRESDRNPPQSLLTRTALQGDPRVSTTAESTTACSSPRRSHPCGSGQRPQPIETYCIFFRRSSSLRVLSSSLFSDFFLMASMSPCVFPRTAS